MKNLGLALLVISTFSCSTIKDFIYKDKCTSGNWEAIGRGDASSISSQNNFNAWISNCAAYSVKPNESEYKKGFYAGMLENCASAGLSAGQSGAPKVAPSTCSDSKQSSNFLNSYAQGLTQYCVNTKAYEAGLSGAEYNSKSCPKSAELDAQYRKGKQFNVLKVEIAKLETEVAEYEKKVFDPTIPAQYKADYTKMLNSKKADLKAKEKELTLLEAHK